jgi:hypothetical protein
MNFVAKQVATNKFFRTVEIFIDDPSILDGTKLFYIDGDTEDLNNRNSWIHLKITAELDRVAFLRDRAISRLNNHFFDLAAFEGNGMYDKESMMGLLNKLGLDINNLIKEGEGGDSLKKVHSMTVCKAINFNEEPDYSRTFAEVEDPLGTLWQVGDDYIEYG